MLYTNYAEAIENVFAHYKNINGKVRIAHSTCFQLHHIEIDRLLRRRRPSSRNVEKQFLLPFRQLHNHFGPSHKLPFFVHKSLSPRSKV